TGKYTVGETFDIILNITSTIKTLDLVDALIEAGIMSDLLDKFYGIIEVFALADNGDRLTIDDTLDKALNLMAEDSSVTVIDLFNSISPETGDTVMDVNKFRPIVEVFAYTDPANKTGAVNLYDLISRFSAILTPDCDIYTIDIINALKDAEIFDLSEMQELLDLICYDANDSTKALTVYGTYNQVMNFDDLYTIDVVEALASNVKLLDEFSNIINVFAYDGTTKLTLAGTLEIFGTITTDQCTIIAKDLVDAVSTDLMDLSRFNNIINLLVLDDAGNKLTISGVFDRIRNITTDTNGVSAKKAIDAANDIIDLSRFNNIINVFVLDNNNNELTIGQVMTRFNTLMIDGESDVYADELVNAVSTDIMDLSAFENIINLLVKYDDGSSVTVGGVLTRINNLMTDYSDISAKKAIDAVGDIISLEAFDSVINYLVLDAGGNELTIGQVMDRVFGIMNEDSDITVKGLLNAVKGIGFDLSAFDPVVDLVAKENGTNLNANATLNRVFNFTDIVVYDIVDALTEMGFDFAGMFSGMGIDINDIYDVLLIDAKDGTTRLKVGELLANVFEIKVGNLASSVGFDLELFGLQSCQELCLNDVLIRNSNDEIIQIDLTKLWDVLDIPLVFETLLQLRPSYLMEKILAKRLTVEYFAEKGLANAEGTELAISIYDREGNRISYTISKQTDTTYFNNNGTISEITTQKHFILDANGNYIYEAYDGSDNRYCDGVRGDDLLNRINFMTISELIDGYATDAQYDMLRKFLPGTTTLAELFMGEGFSTDDTDVTLADFLGENTVNANHILKAIAYNPADGSKIKVSEIDDRLNSLTVSEVILVTDEFGNVTGNYGDGATKILAQVLPAGTLITDIGNVDFAGNIKGLTIKEAMGIGEGQSSGDKYIDMLIEKGATVGNFAETLANLSLLEFAGVELFTEVTVTSSYTSDMALYTFDGNNTYTLVDGSFNVLNGEYTYSSLDTLTKYYVINSDANFWHLMLTTHSDNTPNSEKTSASFGAYDTIVVNNNATVGNFENNEVEIHTDALKIKYMIDIGIATTGTITTSGSVVYGVFDSTIGDAIQALIEKILLAG
ncbi:MAG: hypothetical protein J6V68_01020, partial [Clostridia bacterium]|nr:hypothetical protein [Clostridia bacterium]